MTRNKLSHFLKRNRKIGLDTSIFIFQVEENPNYLKSTEYIFSWLEGIGREAVTSTITMLEVLVHPYRHSDIENVNKFYALLSTYPNLEWIPPTLKICDLAAQIRAQYNLKTPDSIQAATALISEATGFISNDSAFLKIPGLEVIMLDELHSAKKN